MFITGLRYGNDRPRCPSNCCVVWCVYSESGGSAALVLTTRFALVWFWSRQFATLQMRWIMLIHGGELCKNVCFMVWRVCVHVYSCLDNWALSNRDCGLNFPLGRLPRLYTNCNQGDHRCGMSMAFRWLGRCRPFTLLIVKHAGGHEQWGGSDKLLVICWGSLIYLVFFFLALIFLLELL